MTKYFLIIALLSQFIAKSQHTMHWDKVDPPKYAYGNISIDANKIFRFNNNPRTEIQNKGIDFDVEIGARDGHVAVFIYYGRFDPIKYQNYGIGLDYFIHYLRDSGIEFSIGGAYGSILRKLPTGSEGESGWANFLGYSARAKTVYWILDNVAVELKFQYQQRNDIAVAGIYEGTVGVILKFN